MNSKTARRKSRARDELILDFVDRSSLVIRLAIDPMFPDSTPNAISQVIARLREQQYLNRFTLLGNLKYYRLGPAAVKKGRGRRASQTKPLPPAVIPVQLAALFFCNLAGVSRKRLKPSELAKVYPSFPAQLCKQHPYYIDRDAGETRLAMIRVELSGSAQRIIDKHMANVHEYREKYPGVGPMLDNGQLMIVTLFASQEVQTSFCKLLKEHPWYPPARIMCVPDLLNFLPKEKRNAI